MEQVKKAIIDLLKQTSLFCGTENCKFHGWDGKCNLREVGVIEGKCTNYDPAPENPKG